MALIATYSFYYGRKGPHDAEVPIVQKGEEFTALATSQMSVEEAEQSLIRQGAAFRPGEAPKPRKGKAAR